MMADSSREQTSFNLTPLNRAVLTACGATVAVAGGPVAVAQEVQAIEEIIVTARKRSQNLQDVPVSVMAFGAEKIVKQSIQSLEDYARLIPSLTYSSWLPGASMVIFRGVTNTADSFSGNSSAATFFNEMPITSQGLNIDVALVDMERIEAVSGPQPTTYGASAQSGVLKFITARPDFSEFGGFVDVSGSLMEEGNSGYDFRAAVNIPMADDRFALRVVGYQSLQGGFVDNIPGSTADTHDWSTVFDDDSLLATYSYPGGFDGPNTTDPARPRPALDHVTKTNHAVARDNIGDIETQGLRLTGAWQLNENWLATGLYQYQNTYADGIASWHPEFGDLNQIRFNKETRDDEWYIGTLVIEGDLGFADFTSATGYMRRDVVYDLDQSTYLHQFQGVGGVYYNMLDIAYPEGYYYYDFYGNIAAYDCEPEPGYTGCYVYFDGLTNAYAAYAGSISGWGPAYTSPNPLGDPTYYITELTDNTGTMFNDEGSNRFAQELRLTSKDEGQRFQWMIGAYYERLTDNYVFRGSVDNFGDSIAGQIVSRQPEGFVVRSPGQTWYGTGPTEETQWAVFGELGFDITDNLNILLGVRYFEAESETTNTSLNADGTQSNNCLEELIPDPDEPGEFLGVCVTSPANVTPDNRLGTFGGNSSAKEEDTLPLVTVTWGITDDVLSYATMSEGFRIGGTNLLRATSTADRIYSSDTLINNEIGLKMTLMDGRLVWNMAYYQMTWEDMQLVAADPTIAGWGQITANAGEAEINGFETNFALAASEHWTFDGALTFTDSEVTEGASIGTEAVAGEFEDQPIVIISAGEQLPLSPELKWSLGVEYGFPVGNSDGFLRLDYSYVDEQTNATQGSTLLTSSTFLRGEITTLPSYEIANLVLGWGNESWDVSFTVKNLADERALTYKPTRWTDGRVYSVRPREFFLRYRKNF